MKLKIFISSVIAVLFLSGCIPNDAEVQKRPVKDIFHTYSIEDTSIKLATSLAHNLHLKNIKAGDVAMTTFVKLDNFSKTSKFGRILSESLFHELDARYVNMLDFRAKKAISINATGEFYLSRDVKALKKAVSTKYILVGTYSKLTNDNLFINARIISTSSGRVMSTSSAILHRYDCRLFGECSKPNRPIKLTYAKVRK